VEDLHAWEVQKILKIDFYGIEFGSSTKQFCLKLSVQIVRLVLNLQCTTLLVILLTVLLEYCTDYSSGC